MAAWNRAYSAIYVTYLLVGIVARALGWLHLDALWFVEAARRVLDGSFDIYSFRFAPEINPPEGSAFAYSPLIAIIMAPFVALSDALGWGQAGAERLIAIPFLFADVLAMEQLRRLVREWRPQADERFIFLGVAVSLFLTGFWVVTAFRGHHEGLVLLFLLLTLRVTARNWALGGLFAGLALAAKQTAVLELIPLGLVFLLSAGGLRVSAGGLRANWRKVAGWAVVAIGVFAAFMLPALLRDPGGVWYAFVTQESRRVLLGQGLPVWIDKGMSALLDPATYAVWHEALLRYANFGLVAVVAVVSAWVVWSEWRRGRPIGLVDERLLALVAFAALSQIVLAKWVSGHYYQLPLALVLLWDLTRSTRPVSEAVEASGEKSSEQMSMGAWPWIGLGGAVAFRSITAISTPDSPWLRDLLLFALFAALAILALWGAKRKPSGR